MMGRWTKDEYWYAIQFGWLVAAVAGVIALLVYGPSFCGGNYEPDIHEQIKAIDPDHVTAAVRTEPGKPSVEFPQASFDEFLSRVSRLRKTNSIGNREPWSDYCSVEIETETIDPIRIILATRESLRGEARVIIRDRRGNNPRIRFFYGESLLRWLRSNELCTPD